LYSITFFPKSYRSWDNVENILEWFRPQMTKWCKRIECWITKATNTLRLRSTHSFPLQQWLLQRVLMLRYKYIACLVIIACLTKYIMQTWQEEENILKYQWLLKLERLKGKCFVLCWNILKQRDRYTYTSYNSKTCCVLQVLFEDFTWSSQSNGIS